jgi:hypothetical protein
MGRASVKTSSRAGEVLNPVASRTGKRVLHVFSPAVLHGAAFVSVRPERGVMVAMIVGCLAFLVAYPVPPLCDFIAHIGLTLAYVNDPNHLYRLSPNISYKGLFLLSAPTAWLTHTPVATLLTTYLATWLLFFGVVVATLQASGRLTAWRAIAALGFAWPVLHTRQFVWGVIPFCDSFWLALAGILQMTAAAVRSRQSGPDDTASMQPWVGVACLVGSVVFHTFGISLALVGVLWTLGAAMVARRGPTRRRLVIASVVIVCAAIGILLVDARGTGTERFVEQMKWRTLLVEDVTARFRQVFVAAEPYRLMAPLTPYEVWPRWFLRALTILPVGLFAVGAVLAWRRWSLADAFVVALLGAVLFAAVFGPATMFRIADFPDRVYAGIAPLTLGTLCALLPDASRRWVLIAAPFALVVALIAFRPLYRDVQDIMSTAKSLSDALEARLGTEASGGRRVELHYAASAMGTSWWHWRIVPFLSAAEPKLLRDGVYIMNEWNGWNPHLPVLLDEKRLRRVPTSAWTMDLAHFARDSRLAIRAAR